MSRRKQSNPKAVKESRTMMELNDLVLESSKDKEIPRTTEQPFTDIISQITTDLPSKSDDDNSSSFYDNQDLSTDIKPIIDQQLKNINTNQNDSLNSFLPFYTGDFLSAINGNVRKGQEFLRQVIELQTSPKPAVSSKSRRKTDRILPLSDDQGQQNFICPVCFRLLPDNHEFTSHIRTHNTEKCTTTASTTASTTQDDKTDGVNSCKICGKILSSMSSLDRHMLVHSGERPFQCRVCNMSFTTNGNMHRHTRIHLKEQFTATSGNKASPNSALRSPVKSPSFGAAGKPVGIVRMEGVGSGRITNADMLLQFRPRVKRPFMSVWPSGQFGIQKRTRIQSFTKVQKFSNNRDMTKCIVKMISIDISGKSCIYCDKIFLTRYAVIAHCFQHEKLDTSISHEPFNNQSINYGYQGDKEINNRCRSDEGSNSYSMMCDGETKNTSFDQVRTEERISCCGDRGDVGGRRKLNFMCQDCNFVYNTARDIERHFYLRHLAAPCRTSGSTEKKLAKIYNDEKELWKQVGLTASRSLKLLYPNNNNNNVEEVNNNNTKMVNNQPLKCNQCDVRCNTLQDIITHSITIHETKNILEGNRYMASDDPRENIDQSEFLLQLSLKDSNMSDLRTLKDTPHSSDVTGASIQMDCNGNFICMEGGGSESVGATNRMEAIGQQKNAVTALKLVAAATQIKMEPPSRNISAIYQCEFCQYSSTDRSTLIRHMRTHSGERPYKCLICQLAFTTKANCERHLRKKHNYETREEFEKLIGQNTQPSNLRSAYNTYITIPISSQIQKVCTSDVSLPGARGRVEEEGGVSEDFSQKRKKYRLRLCVDPTALRSWIVH